MLVKSMKNAKNNTVWQIQKKGFCTNEMISVEFSVSLKKSEETGQVEDKRNSSRSKHYLQQMNSMPLRMEKNPSDTVSERHIGSFGLSSCLPIGAYQE